MQLKCYFKKLALWPKQKTEEIKTVSTPNSTTNTTTTTTTATTTATAPNSEKNKIGKS